MLHLRCGDDILDGLRAAGVPGTVARWADPLCEGPLRPWPDDGARRAERAAWLAARGAPSESETLAALEQDDMALASAGREDEVVLWFEHDLYDQAILVFLLDRLRELAPDRTSLICIGSHPAHPEFRGLGQLSTAELAALLPARVPVTEAMFAEATSAWAALTGGDPLQVHALAATGTPVLPFLGPALRRWLAELPSTRNGLSQTEAYGLAAVAAGADQPVHAFPTVQRFESCPWQGDAMFFATLRVLATGPRPLLAPVEGKLPRATDRAFATTRLELTTDGRTVLTGRADWCQLARPTRWHGGILLEGASPAWRWEEREERPVRQPG
ncbi:MAG TPA: DUF1835 domain-containing protein [Gemmatimonadales bacterium]